MFLKDFLYFCKNIKQRAGSWYFAFGRIKNPNIRKAPVRSLYWVYDSDVIS